MVLSSLAAVLFLATCASTSAFEAFGGTPDPTALARSPAYHDGSFVNEEPTGLKVRKGVGKAIGHFLLGDEMREPICPLPLVDPSPTLATPPHSGFRVTWLGHSTTLIELDGVTVLTDPQWSERASPSSIAGPKRFHPPPLALEKLPKLDAVVISHDHYDHLDMATVKALAATGVTFHVGLGVGAHLRRWGVKESQIAEHIWWEAATLPGGVQLVSTPSRHFSGRLAARDPTLWTSWTIVGPKHRVFFSGDTGMTHFFTDIAQKFGPFDLAMIEIGQWDPSWSDIHLGPRNALKATQMLSSPRLLPIHWGTFNLALHPWSQPVEEAYVDAVADHVKLLTPKLGEPIEPTDDPPTPPWWHDLPPMASKCP
ncbi:MAG: MBL fold metallo-hydrolase [Deltaproteobacteria bacterium]|nr:MBL fold metallo-hydrolase [Deltaproteobacteria bacterium]